MGPLKRPSRLRNALCRPEILLEFLALAIAFRQLSEMAVALGPQGRNNGLVVRYFLVRGGEEGITFLTPLVWWRLLAHFEKFYQNYFRCALGD